MKYRSRLLALTSMVLCLFFQIWESPAEASNSETRFLRIPVFFITDRNLVLSHSHSDNVTFGPHRKYVYDCKHDSFMGKAYCVIDNVEGKPLTKGLEGLGWAQVKGKEKEGDYKAKLITGDNFDAIEKTFYDQIHEKALLTGDKNIFLFAHGYKNSFKSALHTAARLAYYAERPLILYSWPSVCAFRSYTSDENNVEWSQEHFNDVVTHLEQLCTDDPSVKVRYVAHSMGTRLLVRASPLLREKSYVAEGVLVCPDIDDGLVQHYAKRYLSAKGTATLRVYMSQRDKCLAISQLVHGGYCRFGECADSLSGWALQALMPGKSTDNSGQANVENQEFADVLKKTEKRMQTIDFTVIDKGILGHKIPAPLICSMSFNNSPCKGLKLVSEESGQRSRLSYMLSKFTKLGTKDISIKGTCFRVVKDNSSGPRKLAKTGV